ncbi:MAG: hypothetical protein JST76_02375 [Bacteroidetes bacterium]|nr:hypothetical protein [Bacteroidota bacterium]
MQRRTLLLLTIFVLLIVHGTRHHTATMGRANAWEYNEPLLVDLHIPDQVTTHRSPLHIDIAGTAVSLVPPDGYELLPTMNGYSNADTTIDVVEYGHRSYTDKKSEIDQYIAYLAKDKGADQPVAYHKNFRFNGYPASVICLSDTTRARTAIYMIFGDEHFCVAMTGTTTSDSLAERDAIIQTMLTATCSRV